MQAAMAKEPSPSVLSPVRTVFRAVVVTVVPDAKQLDELGWLALEALVEDALELRAPALRRQLQFFLRAIEWLPVVRYGHTFTGLADEQRSRILRYLQDQPVERIRCGFWGCVPSHFWVITDRRKAHAPSAMVPIHAVGRRSNQDEAPQL
jgi:hypothetical protein